MRRGQGSYTNPILSTAALLASSFLFACGAAQEDEAGHLAQSDPGPVRACAPGLYDGILGPSRIVCAVEDCADPDVTIRVADLGTVVVETSQGPQSAAVHGLYDPETATVWVDDGWFVDDSEWVELIIAHELGHARGLDHVCELWSDKNPCQTEDPHDVMFPASAFEFPLCGPCGCVD